MLVDSFYSVERPSIATTNGEALLFTGHCDEMVPIDSVIEHETNQAWRSASEATVQQEIDDLQESIRVKGLREPITMFKNSNYLISGHTRTKCLQNLGALEIPVIRLERTQAMIDAFGEAGEIDPYHDDVRQEHSISNTRVTTTVFGRYSAARNVFEQTVTGFDASAPVKGQVPIKHKRDILKQYQIGEGTFDNVEQIRFGTNKTIKGEAFFIPPRDDLYDDLQNPAKDYAVRQLIKIQEKDFKEENFKDWFPRQDDIEDALDAISYTFLAEEVYVDLESCTWEWFKSQDDNFISTCVSHSVTHHTTVLLNDAFQELNLPYSAVVPGNQSHYDILIQDKNGNDVSSVEVKATSGKTNWNSGTQKKGYAVLFAYNKEWTSAFAATAYLESDDWEGGVAGKYLLQAKTLYNKDDGDVTCRLGDLDLDNSVYRIQKQRLTNI